jgi:Methylase involved in ubiquinone/menaquinone biosynthesis
MELDAACREWHERWMQRMNYHCPGRAHYLQLIAHTIAARAQGQPVKLLDLGCGSGAFCSAALQQIPSCEIVAVDASAKSLLVGKTLWGQERIRWIESDLLSAELFASLPARSFDVVFTGWTLHEIGSDELPALYRNCFELLKPGGQLFNFDFMLRGDPEEQRYLNEITRADIPQDWRAFDDSFVAEFLPGYVAPSSSRPNRGQHAVELHRQALLAAGFSAVEERFRHLHQSLLVATK